MINNIFPVITGDTRPHYYKKPIKGWKKEDSGPKSDYKSDHNIFNMKDHSQVLSNDKNYYKDLAKERSERIIEDRLRVRNILQIKNNLVYFPLLPRV
jgi:hypothetical protein